MFGAGGGSCGSNDGMIMCGLGVETYYLVLIKMNTKSNKGLADFSRLGIVYTSLIAFGALVKCMRHTHCIPPDTIPHQADASKKNDIINKEAILR